MMDRIAIVDPSREADILKVFSAYTLAAHEIAHVLVRYDISDEKQEYHMTAEEFDIGYMTGGSEAGRALENSIYHGILHLVCRKDVKWSSHTSIKVLRFMLVTLQGEREVDSGCLIQAFYSNQVIQMPVQGPLLLDHLKEIVRKDAGALFKRFSSMEGMNIMYVEICSCLDHNQQYDNQRSSCRKNESSEINKTLCCRISDRFQGFWTI